MISPVDVCVTSPCAKTGNMQLVELLQAVDIAIQSRMSLKKSYTTVKCNAVQCSEVESRYAGAQVRRQDCSVQL